jgi:hypothetical protein
VHAHKEPELLNLGVPVVNFPRANAILARAQALLWHDNNESHIDKLWKLQMRAARIISSSDYTLDHPKSLKPFNGIQ